MRLLMQKLEKSHVSFSIFHRKRISKRRNGETGNVERLQRIIQDSFN